VAGDYPIKDIVVGNGDGEVPLDKLQMTLMKLPRVIKGGEIDTLERRLRAVGTANLPIPKGPMPTRVPRGKMR
jgi:predicted transcriptional regulator